MSDTHCEECRRELGWPYKFVWPIGNVCQECLIVKEVEKKLGSEVPRFDPDLSPSHLTNTDAARRLGLRYDAGRRQYLDSDGCPVRDRFGQPLG